MIGRNYTFVWESGRCIIDVVMFDMAIWLKIMMMNHDVRVQCMNNWELHSLVFGHNLPFLLKTVVLTKATRTFPNDIYILNSCHFVRCSVYTLMCPNAWLITFQYVHWLLTFPHHRHSNCRRRWHHTYAIVDISYHKHSRYITSYHPIANVGWVRHHLGLSTWKWVNQGMCSILDFRCANERHTCGPRTKRWQLVASMHIDTDLGCAIGCCLGIISMPKIS